MTELTEAFISRVFLTYRGTLLPAGALLSPYPPAGTLMFRWTPVEEFAVAAHKAVEMNLIRGTDEFWDAYQKCQDDPELVVYVPLSRAEVQEVFREGGEISAVCSDPISAVPLDVDEEDA